MTRPLSFTSWRTGLSMSAEARLKEKNITLPKTTSPMANYVGAVRTGNLLFVSGHGPVRDGKATAQGKVGKDLSVEQGYQVAREVGLALLATVRANLGSLDKVRRVVKVLGMVNSAEGFGEAIGKHARSAVGMGGLPVNIPVEIEMVLEVE